MENTITTTQFTESEALEIHKELHTKHLGEFITHKTKHYTIHTMIRTGTKCVNIGGDVFAIQNKFEPGKLADRANRGELITNIIPSDGSEWGLIIGKKVEKLI